MAAIQARVHASAFTVPRATFFAIERASSAGEISADLLRLMAGAGLWRRDRAGAFGDEPVVLDPPVRGEIEHVLLVELADVEIAPREDELVADRRRARHDLARRRHDAAAAEELAALLAPRLGDGDDPDAVLVGGGLERKRVVEIGQVIEDRHPRNMRRRVVAEQHELRTLERHHPVRLRPAPIIADAHARDAAECAPDRKTEIADVEILLLEMLERQAFLVVGVPRQVNLAVLADDLAGLVDEDG